jgi:hypothetical protein
MLFGLPYTVHISRKMARDLLGYFWIDAHVERSRTLLSLSGDSTTYFLTISPPHSLSQKLRKNYRITLIVSAKRSCAGF